MVIKIISSDVLTFQRSLLGGSKSENPVSTPSSQHWATHKPCSVHSGITQTLIQTPHQPTGQDTCPPGPAEEPRAIPAPAGTEPLHISNSQRTNPPPGKLRTILGQKAQGRDLSPSETCARKASPVPAQHHKHSDSSCTRGVHAHLSN